ncbi:hypothetical protein KKB44_06495 [Candidatus Micrarchaeota archaeon]|nr:hypothetical protein [Candidatus Micrarchaeota archaeon]
MEDTIEICSGCGKMPRPIDRMQGYFICSRCGNRSTIMVTADDYERIAMELDQKFHETILRSKAAAIKEEPAIPFDNPGKKSKKKKPAKKVAKKKTTKKKTTKKKTVKKKKRK